MWNHFEIHDTISWIEQIEKEIRPRIPLFVDSPRLFLTSNAQAENKPAKYVPLENNIRIQNYVHAVETFVKERGYDHLGFYNMTIQASSPDGTHASLETTLIEAQMVLNWLSLLE